MKKQLGDTVIRLLMDDITRVPVDAMANAANSGLRGGSGVDGAIHRAGGPEIMRELGAIRATVGGCPTGSAVVTGAGDLPAKYVFHAVGPIYHGGGHGEAQDLASCYTTCLRLADEHNVERISFPSISTGVYGYPVSDAARVALRAVVDYLRRYQSTVREVIFVFFDKTTHDAYAESLEEVLGEIRS